MYVCVGGRGKEEAEEEKAEVLGMKMNKRWLSPLSNQVAKAVCGVWREAERAGW